VKIKSIIMYYVQYEDVVRTFPTDNSERASQWFGGYDTLTSSSCENKQYNNVLCALINMKHKLEFFSNRVSDRIPDRMPDNDVGLAKYSQ
jgi:hypothetical protein